MVEIRPFAYAFWIPARTRVGLEGVFALPPSSAQRFLKHIETANVIKDNDLNTLVNMSLS